VINVKVGRIQTVALRPVSTYHLYKIYHKKCSTPSIDIKHMDANTHTQTNAQTNAHTDTQTNKHTNKHTHTHTHTQT